MSAFSAQTNLFSQPPVDLGPRQLIDDAEGGIRYTPGLLDPATALQWFEALRYGIAWQAQRRPMYDRMVDVPRLVAAWRLDAADLPESLWHAATVLRAQLDTPFNSVGLNYYRDGRDSVAPHHDKLHSLARGYPIALLSLGAPRRMTIRARQPPRLPLHIELEPGSLLAMSYDSQLHHEHGIAKTRHPVGPRISLAFRVRRPDFVSGRA